VFPPKKFFWVSEFALLSPITNNSIRLLREKIKRIPAGVTKLKQTAKYYRVKDAVFQSIPSIPRNKNPALWSAPQGGVRAFQFIPFRNQLIRR
jgi:hypothetical protein